MLESQSGHRKRLRQRFLKGGLNAVADYEILEMILFSAYPRGDTKHIAKALLASFRTVAKVIQADESELKKIKHVGEAAVAALKITFAGAQILLRSEIENKTILASFKQVVDYCKLAMSHLKVEQLRLLFLDKKHRLIADEVQQGTVDHTPFYPREVIRRCLEIGATGLIIVHNHPSGESQPSKADIHITHEIQKIAKGLDITVHDHIIIGRGNFTSFKNAGLLLN